MNHTFTERWLVQEDPGKRQLMIYQLIERDKQWIADPHGSWTDFLGTPEALHSLGQPETELILNLNTAAENNSACGVLWCCVQDSPVRCNTIAMTTEHLALKEELDRHGKDLQVIQCDRINDWPRAPRFVEVSAHEAKAIRAWAHSINTPMASKANYMALALRLYTHSTREVAHKRASMLLLTVGLLGVFHWHANGDVFEPAKPAQTIVRQTPPAKTHIEPDWQGWQNKQQRFGENRQANITHLQFAWRDDGAIYSQAALQKPRKRMPKGCSTTEQLPLVECIQMPQGETVTKRGRP